MYFCNFVLIFMPLQAKKHLKNLCYDKFKKDYNSNTLLERLIAAAGAFSTLNQIL